MPQMKPPGDILKMTKRKRVKLGSLYANPHKKRRFKPKPHLKNMKPINSTEDSDVPKKEEESSNLTSPRPQISPRTTRNPIIPDSFPKFHNISVSHPGSASSSSPKPRTMMGWTARPQERSGPRLSRPERRRESSNRANSLSEETVDNGKSKEQLREKVPGSAPAPVRAKVAKRWPPLPSLPSTTKPPTASPSTALPISTDTPLAAELMVDPVAASSTTLRSIPSSREVSYISGEVSNEMSREGNDLSRLNREKADTSKEVISFGSKEVANNSKERVFEVRPDREKTKESNGSTNLGDRRGKGLRKKEGVNKQRQPLSEDFGQASEVSNNIESFEDFISFGTKENEKQRGSYSYEVSREEDNILSLGLGIEEVADSGESDYRYQYRIVSSSEEEERNEPRAVLALQPVSTSEDGLFHPESQLFPSDPAAFMRVDFDQNFGEKSSEQMEKQEEEETETYPEEQDDEKREMKKTSIEVDLSHLPMEHRGEAAWSPPSPPTSFLQFGRLPPPRPASPPPNPPAAPKDSLPTDYPHPLPLPKEPLPSATERDGPHVVEVEGRSLPPPTASAPIPPVASPTTLTPRTPKLVATPKGQPPKRSVLPAGDSPLVSRTSYTVTTPASYVFFEQVNVTPAPEHFSHIQKTMTPKKKKAPSQRKKAFESSKEKQRKKRPPKKQSPPKRQISKEEEMRSTLERQIGQDELYFPNDQDYFPAGGRPSVQRPGNNYNFNHVSSGPTSYRPNPVNSIGHHQPHKPTVFHPPTPSYHTPTPTYHTPTPTYHTPEPVYHTPQPSYRPPKPTGYQPPFTTFNPLTNSNPFSFSLPALPSLPSLPFTRTPSPPPRPPRAPTRRSDLRNKSKLC